MAKLDRPFNNLLRSHRFEDLEAHTGAIYGIWASFHLAYLNPEWFRFARENGGEPSISAEWGLGRSVLDCVSGEIKVFYEARFNACLDSHTVWSHDYECSSDSIFRFYHQIVYPLGQREGLLIVNSLIVKGLHDPEQKPLRSADESKYVDENGFISQCAFCRRVKNPREPERWDWVPEWVKRCPENTSHTFCPSCYGHYFPVPANN